MSDGLQFEVCPETGIGCLMVDQAKIDLMPDETDAFQEMIRAGDLAGARALLAGVDPQAAQSFDDDSLRALAGEIG